MFYSPFFRLLIAFLLLAFSSACVPEEVQDSLDTALDLVEDGIRSINNQSDQWRSSLEFIHSELPEDLHWVKDDVSQLISEGIGATTSNVLCVIDAIPNRMVRGLERVKAKLLEQTLPPLAPTVCNTTLSTIDMNAPAHNRTEIIINGYDFTHGSLLQLVLRRSNGNETVVTESRLFKQSDYQYTINIANWDNILEQYVALVLKFDGEVLSEFGIIPPDVTCRATLSIVNEREVWVELYFHVKETKSDWSEARYLESHHLKTIPSGFRFNRWLSDTETVWTYEDTDHNVDVRTYSSAHLIKEFRAKGDTDGDDIGNCTNDDAYMTAIFNKVKLEIIED